MKRKSTFVAAITLALGMAIIPAAFAAGSHDHAPKFGGIVSEGKGFDAELVARPELITIHLYEDKKAISTKAAKAKITILNGVEKTETILMPAGESSLEAKGKFNVSKGTKAVVEITLEGKKPSTVRFAIK